MEDRTVNVFHFNRQIIPRSRFHYQFQHEEYTAKKVQKSPYETLEEYKRRKLINRRYLGGGQRTRVWGKNAKRYYTGEIDNKNGYVFVLGTEIFPIKNFYHMRYHIPKSEGGGGSDTVELPGHKIQKIMEWEDSEEECVSSSEEECGVERNEEDDGNGEESPSDTEYEEEEEEKKSAKTSVNTQTPPPPSPIQEDIVRFMREHQPLVNIKELIDYITRKYPRIPPLIIQAILKEKLTLKNRQIWLKDEEEAN